MNTQITKIKIFGERNSGTNYIEKLLTKNIKSQVYIESGNYKSKLGWKHGLPNQQKIDVNNTLVVCIIRDLDTWMNSMYYSPYHLIKKKNFSDIGFAMFNTSHGNKVILGMPGAIKKALRKPTAAGQFDALFGLTHGLKSYDSWMHDNECWPPVYADTG